MKKKSILIADDEPNILGLLKQILSNDYNLVLVEDGIRTLAAVKKKKPDLLLLDVMMPRLNGYEVCEKLRADPKTKDIKIVMLSAKGQESDLIYGLKLGADCYITKPFDPYELEKTIEEMLR